MALVAGVSVLGCASQPVAPVCDASAQPGCGEPGARGLGLRVALSDSAKSVCVFDNGCAGAPKGAIRIQPLEPKLRKALSEALVAVGFELVDHDAERDMVADVEWRGTDTIALRLQDARGKLIDQASFSRSLERCRDLPELTWDSCWAANFPSMKEALTRPLRASPALQAFAQRSRQVGAEAAIVEVAPTQLAKRPGVGSTVREASAPATLPEQLDALQFQETVARYREELQRACWLPAVESRDPSAPSSARVGTTVTVSPSGSVASVTTGGDPLGYPRLAGCIAGQLRRWAFPAARSSSVASIPFVFASD